MQFEGELHNGVLVVQSFLGCDRDRAVQVLNDLMTARLEQFQHIVAIDLPALFEQRDVEQATRDVLTTYAAELQDWMAGILKWHQTCRRYDESELRRDPVTQRPIGVPAGLGTSAARLSAGSSPV
jgi:germacradienol/geosmin synthase